MKTHRIAVIAGDGIGQEVVPEGIRVLEAAASRFGIGLQFDQFDFASWPYYERHGSMMPADWKEQIGGHDAIFFGAVGWPEKIPDHISLWGSLLKFRREFDLYVNLRPARLMPGVRSPLAGLAPGDIDMMIVRENTEGEYSSIGGRMFEGSEREVVVQETVMSRIGIDRVLKYAFELAQSRPKKHLTSATKSNGIAITMPYWDERVEAMAPRFPERSRRPVSHRHPHRALRSAAADLRHRRRQQPVRRHPERSRPGVHAEPSASRLRPTSTRRAQHPSLFEPVHGSAPDIAGQGIANPIGQIWAGAMMLDFLGHREAHDAVIAAIEAVLDPAAGGPKTRDLGGRASTGDLGRAVASALAPARASVVAASR